MSRPSLAARPAPNPNTTAWRVLDGGDLEVRQWETRVDNFAGHWLVQTRDVEFPDELRGVTGRDEAVKSLWWKKLDRDDRGKQAPEWIEGERVGERFLVEEHGAQYWVDFAAGYSQGIFLDQRLNRDWVRQRCEDGDRVLNTFAYTGAFSIAAALGGAVTTTLDLSNPYLAWAHDLEAAWNDRFEADFGFAVDRASNGVLQDVHWSVGLIGYFPTYSLGNVYAGCLYEGLRDAVPTLDADLTIGNTDLATRWLRDNVQTHGGLFEPRDVISRATGSAPSEAPLLAYLKTKFSDIYGL